jgi:hypothetical protein
MPTKKTKPKKNLICNQYLYRYQTFRYPEKGNDRIRTQVLIKGVAVRGKQIIEPRHVLTDMGVDANMIERLLQAATSGNGGAGDGGAVSSSFNHGENAITANSSMEAMLIHFEGLDETFRVSANHDDNSLVVVNEEEGQK